MKNIRKFIIFCFIGLGAFLIDWLFFNIIYSIVPWFISSRILSALISMIFNFNMNRNITFSARGYSVKKQLVKWIVVYSVAIGANAILGKFVLKFLGESLLNANIAFFAGLAVSIPISFLGSLLWAFNKKD